MSNETTHGSAVISPLLNPEPLVDTSMTDFYDAMGFEWEKCPLRWNPSKPTRTGMGAKDGISQGCGKHHPDWNGYLLHLEGLLAIDIDGTDAECMKLRALCEQSAALIARTRKGNHYVFNAHPSIQSFNAQKGSSTEVDTKTGRTSVLLVEPSFYEHPEEGRVRYEWVRRPASRAEITDVPAPVMDWLRTHNGGKYVLTPSGGCGASASPPADEPEEAAPAPTTPADADEITKLCDCLSPAFLAEHSNWLRLLYAMKNIAKGKPVAEAAALRTLFLNTSARAPAYNSAAYRAQNAKMWDETDAKGLSGLGTLKHFAKLCDEARYFAIYRDEYWSLIQDETNNAWCRIFYLAMGGDVLYSFAHKQYYIYNRVSCLWEPQTTPQMNWMFVEMTSSVFRRLLGELPIATTEEEAERRKGKEKILRRAMTVCGGTGITRMVSEFLPALCAPPIDPALKFDADPDLLALNNGVYQFSTGKLIPFEREHYFTFKRDIDYDPTADTSDIEKAVMDWFHQDVDVAKYVQYWTGYCLTGYVDRQEFIIVWGSKAGNGKSLFWGDILALLHGKTGGELQSHYATISSDALNAERTGNNDELYNLNGKRYAFLSEPRKGARSKMDSELVKNLTGDARITCSAKYKAPLTFNLRVKFAMACNDLPDLAFDDEGILRRVIVIKQNVRFLDPTEYEASSAAEKDSHSVKLKDDAFRERLLANKSGLLLWALRGADAFMANRRLPAPAAVRAAKAEAVETTDRLGNWFEACIRKTTASRAAVRLTDVKAELLRWLGEAKLPRGFDAKFKEKAEKLGFDVGGRVGKGDLYLRGVEFSPDGYGLEDEADVITTF
jgi:P4 family phage/plasmid primase-like protien